MICSRAVVYRSRNTMRTGATVNQTEYCGRLHLIHGKVPPVCPQDLSWKRFRGTIKVPLKLQVRMRFGRSDEISSVLIGQQILCVHLTSHMWTYDMETSLRTSVQYFSKVKAESYKMWSFLNPRTNTRHSLGYHSKQMSVNVESPSVCKSLLHYHSDVDRDNQEPLVKEPWQIQSRAAFSFRRGEEKVGEVQEWMKRNKKNEVLKSRKERSEGTVGKKTGHKTSWFIASLPVRVHIHTQTQTQWNCGWETV